MPYDSAKHGPRRIVGPGFHQQVYDVVKTVPAGRVTTYGDVASVLGMRNVARHVGFALAALEPGQGEIPWHRVVNGQGRISVRGAEAPSSEQRLRLIDEGLHVTLDGRVEQFRTVRHVF